MLVVLAGVDECCETISQAEIYICLVLLLYRIILFTIGEGSEVSSHGIGVVDIASEGQTLAY